MAFQIACWQALLTAVAAVAVLERAAATWLAQQVPDVAVEVLVPAVVLASGGLV